MSALSGGVSQKLMNGLQACGYASKVDDIKDSASSVSETLRDANMSAIAKTAKCTAEGVFMLARLSEITQDVSDYRGKAIRNCYATAADTSRKLVDACITSESGAETIKKVAFCIVTGGTEATTNLALVTNNMTLACLGTFVSVTFGIIRIVSRASRSPVADPG